MLVTNMVVLGILDFNLPLVKIRDLSFLMNLQTVLMNESLKSITFHFKFY